MGARRAARAQGRQRSPCKRERHLAFRQGQRGQRALRRRQAAFVNLAAQLGVAQVVRACVGGGQIVERLGLLAGGLKHIGAGDEHRLLNACGEHGVDGVEEQHASSRSMTFVRVTKKSTTSARTAAVELNALLGVSASDASMAAASETWAGPSSMVTMPMALRRNANGSEEPVGPWPTANRPQMVSSLSAIATMLAHVDSGSSSPEKRGR